jgi:hypothetical protein
MDNVTVASNFTPIQTVSGNSIINPFMYFKSKINEFILLRDNWDGYGGVPLLQLIGDKANLFVTLLNSSYIDLIADVFPNPNGTITIEWETKKEEKISLEIGENNYSYFLKLNNKEPKFINGEDIITDKEIFTKALSKLFSENFYSPVFR